MAAYSYAEARSDGASKLPLSTSEADQPLYARVMGRTLEVDGIGPMDKITDYTLVECFRDDPATGGRQILLGMKKRGLGANKYNGFGGKFDEGETAVECAKRETEEECGLRPRTMEWRAQLLFTFRDSGGVMRVHVFEASDFDEADLVETEEMAPRWFDCDRVPFRSMWNDDVFWLPLLLDGVRFEAWFDYAVGGETANTVEEYELNRIVEDAPPPKPAATRQSLRNAMSPP